VTNPNDKDPLTKYDPITVTKSTNVNPLEKKRKVESVWGNTSVTFPTPEGGTVTTTPTTITTVTPISTIRFGNTVVKTGVSNPTDGKPEQHIFKSPVTVEKTSSRYTRFGDQLVRTGVNNTGISNTIDSPITVVKKERRVQTTTMIELPQERQGSIKSNLTVPSFDSTSRLDNI
jgi:hypothetical protein